MKTTALSVLILSACPNPLPQVPGQGGVVIASVCGDGVVGAGEACDDANLIDFDACTSECTNAGCGDGITRRDLDPLEEGYEACDDGNDRDDDGCTNGCLSPKCGDGRVFQNSGVGGEGYEECDDGNRSSNDGCTVHCMVARCGDGFVRTNANIDSDIEACDDGNQVDTDGCRTNCTAASCGDGVQRRDLAAGEQQSCAQDADCSAGSICQRGLCLPIGYEGCDDANAADDDDCLNGCVAARCGDGAVRSDRSAGDVDYEACDDGNRLAEDGCNNDCGVAACGDGVRRADLDDLVRGANATCNLGCRDNEVCLGSICYPEGYEACDDGNINDSDRCVGCQLAGSTPASAGRSCIHLLAQGLDQSGVYWLDFDGAEEGVQPAQFYCDQVSDGGGWVRLFGANTPTRSACDWFHYSQWSVFIPNREDEPAFEMAAPSWFLQCDPSGLLARGRSNIRAELRITLTTPFEFSAIRYAGNLLVAADSGLQTFILPTARFRHTVAEQRRGWTRVESCEPITMDESIDPFVSSGDSLSWLLSAYSPAQGCPNDTQFQIDELMVR